MSSLFHFLKIITIFASFNGLGMFCCSMVSSPAFSVSMLTDIGVLFDSAMSMAKNVSRVCQMAYCQLRSIARIRRSITTTACGTIVHALVMSRLDYCNAVLYGLPDAQLQKLQLVQNATARLVTGTIDGST